MAPNIAQICWLSAATTPASGAVRSIWKPRSLERKLVAILAADVEGYSRMMEIDEEGTLRDPVGPSHHHR